MSGLFFCGSITAAEQVTHDPVITPARASVVFVDGVKSACYRHAHDRDPGFEQQCVRATVATTRRPSRTPWRACLIAAALFYAPGQIDPAAQAFCVCIPGQVSLCVAMNLKNQLIRRSRLDDATAIEQLHDEAFGPGRFARTAYRVREAACQPRLGFGLTAWCNELLAGAVHLTPVTIGGKGSVMMLGPLAVAPRFKGQGYGRWLVEEGVALARDEGAELVILVGDLPYYSRMGFIRVPPGSIRLPGPVDPQRILARELVKGVLENFSGPVAAAPRDNANTRADPGAATLQQNTPPTG